ncbi:Fatty acid 2-hydroxylase [Porphyridium purpureum]|uniref:Fatty acid 2-hydroxylase n=1 Tax=Porphyridium purpureum TaxID=35688 RepID=A0A5J4YKP7_PORPP|nr:Fatty acid 2-hydroxylase [Porphyridium purpureum]|eukprot:POR6358..scf244_11
MPPSREGAGVDSVTTVAPTPARDDGYSLTRRLVSFHSSAHDAWVVLNNDVYDVTLFLDRHPGGKKILEKHLGTDVSEIMAADKPHRHSAAAYKQLRAYQIGTLAPTERTDADKTASSNVTSDTQEELDRLVDWTKPLLPQVGNMGVQYDAWVHSFPTTDHTVKMFQNDVLEFLTKCPWYLPLVFWIPVAILILTQYFMTVTVHIPTFVSWCAAGVVFWLLFEYTLHRWVFHMNSTSYWGNIIHFLIHGHHHITPMDNNRVVFPPIPALLFASPIWVGALSLLGYERGYAFLLGFLIGYLNYDMTHFWIHQRVPKSGYVQWHKKRHVYHHYHKPGVNFGISHPLFDWVFGTFEGDYTSSSVTAAKH